MFARPASTRYFRTFDNNYHIIITIIVIIVTIFVIIIISSSSSSNSKNNSSRILNKHLSEKWYISESFTVKGSALLKNKMY